MQYQLNISIDQAALGMIYSSGQAVAIVRNAGSTPEYPSAVAWIVFEPMESNQISWEDSYQVYATETEPLIGTTIAMMSTTPAQTGWSYVFENGQFTGSAGGNDPQGFEIFSQQEGRTGFGLAQQASVNGTGILAPLSIFELLNEQTGSTTPYETVSIYLVQNTGNGTLVQDAPPNAYTFALTPGSPVAQIMYNDGTEGFGPG